MCYPFLAQVVTTEQAAKALADQTYNQPVNWWLAFIASMVTGALIILIIRAFKKSDVTEELLRKANEDRMTVATSYQVLSGKILEDLDDMKGTLKTLHEEVIKFIYRSGGGK